MHIRRVNTNSIGVAVSVQTTAAALMGLAAAASVPDEPQDEPNKQDMARALVAAFAALTAPPEPPDKRRKKEQEKTKKPERQKSQQAQKQEFNDALKQIEQELGRPLSRAERRRLHDEITRRDIGVEEIVQHASDMFRRKHGPTIE